MNFDDILHDIEKMKGMVLKSLRPGANITVDSVNAKEGRYIIFIKNGEPRSRPISELKKIWEELCISPAIRVESVLEGAGSSRNQPETIMANLPYIEWLMINNKKHICLKKVNSHPLGSIKKVDSIEADEIRKSLAAVPMIMREMPEIVVVTNNIPASSKLLEKTLGRKFSTVELGVYKIESPTFSILLISKEALSVNVPSGVYIVVEQKGNTGNEKLIAFGSTTYRVITDGNGLNLLSKV